jgi:hypothetical protein
LNDEIRWEEKWRGMEGRVKDRKEGGRQRRKRSDVKKHGKKRGEKMR